MVSKVVEVFGGECDLLVGDEDHVHVSRARMCVSVCGVCAESFKLQ